MAQLPNVKLKVHPSMFDLMMAVLERNAAVEDVPTRNNALDLMEKRMRFTRLSPARTANSTPASRCMTVKPPR